MMDSTIDSIFNHSVSGASQGKTQTRHNGAWNYVNWKTLKVKLCPGYDWMIHQCLTKKWVKITIKKSIDLPQILISHCLKANWRLALCSHIQMACTYQEQIPTMQIKKVIRNVFVIIRSHFIIAKIDERNLLCCLCVWILATVCSIAKNHPKHQSTIR